MLRHLVIALLLCTRISFAREVPADWKFITLHTPHFDVIVNAKQQGLGELMAAKLEKSFSLLEKLFTDRPQKTVVVIADRTDLTNGYATRLPYPHIFLYPVLPGPNDSLADGGDWFFELSAHEFTHILTFDAVSGVMEPLQSIFGTILSPNLLLPRWWKEGVAVQAETMLSNGGRLRSPYQDGHIRLWSEEKTLFDFDLAQINEILPDWPRGMRPYLFGSLFWSAAVAEKGPAIIDQLHQRHGGRVPYFVEAPSRDLLGTSYDGFYTRMLVEIDRRAKEQIFKLETQPLTEPRPVGVNAMFSQNPRISPDGQRLAVIGVDPTDRRSVMILQRGRDGSFQEPLVVSEVGDLLEEEKPPIRDAPPSGSITRISWFPDGRRLVFDKTDAVSSTESYSDLWIYNLDTTRSERLTTAQRAREPAVSPRGHRIAYVGLEGGRTSLWLWDMTAKTASRLWQGDWQERISFPTWLDEERLVFSWRRPDKSEHLFVISASQASIPQTGTEPRRILEDFPHSRFAELTSRGLIFVSDRNGVANLFLASGDLRSARPLTHVLGGVLSSTIDGRQGDLLLTSLTTQGPRVTRVPAHEIFDGGLAKSRELPSVEPLLADRYPLPPANASEPSFTTEVGDYAPGSYLWPRYWFPLFTISTFSNNLVFEAATSAFDPLKKHAYTVAVGWDAGLKKGSYQASYENNVWPHTLRAAAAQTNSYLVTPDTPVTSESFSASVEPDLFRLHRHLSATLGVRGVRTDVAGVTASRLGPSIYAQYVDYDRAGWQISPEQGWQAYGGATSYQPGENRISYNQYLVGGKFFASKFLPARHALAFRLDSVVVPETLGAAFGTSSTNTFFQNDSPVPMFVMRGYRIGHFFGKTMANTTLEYRFPLREIRRGHGTDPLYITRVHGALFADGLHVDGFAYRTSTASLEPTKLGERGFWSMGAEARVETTVGYFLPLNLVGGFAVPLDRTFGGDASFGLSIQMGTLF